MSILSFIIITGIRGEFIIVFLTRNNIVHIILNILYMMKPRYQYLLAILSMTLVIVISNILVSIPINNWLTWWAFSFPLVYLVIDLSNRSLGPKSARQVAWFSLPIAVLASWYFADWRIAIASGTAFIAGQMLDITFFNFLRKQSWWKAPWVGSIIGSVIDTILFFSIAFAGTELNWVQLATGDLSIKWIMASILLIPYRLLMPILSTWWRSKNS